MIPALDAAYAARAAVHARARSDRQHAAVAGAPHAGERTTRAQERPGEVHRHRLLPALERCLLERLDDEDARIQHEQRDRPELGLRACECGIDGFGIGDVPDHSQDVRDHRRRQVDPGDGGAQVGEPLADPAPDATSGAGHERHLAIESVQSHARLPFARNRFRIRFHRSE
jgi:hypothetical protein